VNFEDDLLTLNHKHVSAICNEIIARGLKFNWSAFSRVDTVNPEILRKMRGAGCTWVLYGVESGNQEILDTIKKKITLEKVRESVRMAYDAGISVQASFIVGLPGETKETLQQSLQFARGLGASYGFHVLSPFPGTEVRERAREYGIEILTNDWSKYDCNHPITRTNSVGPDEIAAFLQEYFQQLQRYLASLRKVDKSEQADAEKAERRGPLSATVLKGDVIESLGPVKMEGEPVNGLIKRLAELVPYSRRQIDEEVRNWVKRGLVKYDLKDEYPVWRWA